MQQLTEICIRRPVFAIVINLILVLIGLSSYYYLNLRFFPQFKTHHINIEASFSGANAKLVENTVTNPIESALSTVAGVKQMTSTSSRGSSLVTLKLQNTADINQVTNAVRNSLSRAQAKLPDAVEPPTVKVGHSSSSFLHMAITDSKRTPSQIRDYFKRFVKNDLLQIPGMAKINIQGAHKQAVRIDLNPRKMAAYGLNVDPIIKALKSNNVQMPAGQVRSQAFNYPINAETNFQSLNDFRNMVITRNDDALVHLNDIAQIHLASQSSNQRLLTIRGQPTVSPVLYNEQDASPITVNKRLHKVLPQIKADLPESMHLTSFFNNTDFLKSAVHEVYITLLVAVICVLIAIFLFLGHWRAVLIPIITVPICLITTFALMGLLQYSLNVITLLALVLAIGLVVDDAIVMLENIYRYLERGLQPVQAALVGSREIVFAVIGMTVCLAAVYAPVGLIHNEIAIIFQEFAYTLACAVLISGFVALTLTPMMCSRLLKPNDLQSGFSLWLEKFFDKLRYRHSRFLGWVLHKKIWVIILTLTFAGLGYATLTTLPTQFMPDEDMGFAITVLDTPSNANFATIQKQAQKARKIVKKQPAVQRVSTHITEEAGGFNQIFVVLKPYDQRQISGQKLAKQLTQQFKQVPGLDAFVFAPSPFSGGSHYDIKWVLTTSQSYNELYHNYNAIKDELGDYPGLNHISASVSFDNQQYKVNIRKNLANSLGLSTRTIDRSLSVMMGGMTVTRFNRDNATYDVKLKAQPQFQHNLQQLSQFQLFTQNHKRIPLNNLLTIHRSNAQQTLNHYNQLRSLTVQGQLASGYALGDVVNYLTNTLPQLTDDHTSFTFTGMAKDLKRNNNSMLIIFGLSFLVIYLVLAALFESFLDPFIVLLTVPISIVGALMALKLAGGSLNIYTDIGLVTLIGLIAKHGILITQFANELLAEGYELTQAIIKATSIRLRPILMTTTAMISGALPLILAQGSNANSRLQLGLVIIFGLIVGTLFSLFIVPVAYQILKRPTTPPNAAKNPDTSY